MPANDLVVISTAATASGPLGDGTLRMPGVEVTGSQRPCGATREHRQAMARDVLQSGCWGFSDRTQGALRCDEIEIETIKIKTKSKSNLF